MHFFSTCMVCLGAHFSAIWIVVANSWMQTPAGFHLVKTPLGPRAEITDFWAVVFNPSSMDRLFHVLCGCWQAGAFLVISVSAWYLLRNKHLEFARASMRVGLGAGLAASLLSLVLGSVSERTADCATVPTLVVRDAAPFEAWTRGDRPLKVFVAFNFTVASEAALRWIRELWQGVIKVARHCAPMDSHSPLVAEIGGRSTLKPLRFSTRAR